MMYIVVCSCASTIFTWPIFSHDGQQYSAVENTNARVEVRNVLVFVPHVLPASIRTTLFLVEIFLIVFSLCAWKVWDLSNVTPIGIQALHRPQGLFLLFFAYSGNMTPQSSSQVTMSSVSTSLITIITSVTQTMR